MISQHSSPRLTKTPIQPTPGLTQYICFCNFHQFIYPPPPPFSALGIWQLFAYIMLVIVFMRFSRLSSYLSRCLKTLPYTFYWKTIQMTALAGCSFTTKTHLLIYNLYWDSIGLILRYTMASIHIAMSYSRRSSMPISFVLLSSVGFGEISHLYLSKCSFLL